MADKTILFAHSLNLESLEILRTKTISHSTSTPARGEDIPCYGYMSPLSLTVESDPLTVREMTHIPVIGYIFPSKRCTPTREDAEEIGFVQCKRNLKESNSDFNFASSYRLVSSFQPKWPVGTPNFAPII